MIRLLMLCVNIPWFIFLYALTDIGMSVFQVIENLLREN